MNKSLIDETSEAFHSWRFSEEVSPLERFILWSRPSSDMYDEYDVSHSKLLIKAN